MELYKIQIIESLAVLAGYAAVHYTTNRLINNSLKQIHLERGRRKTIVKSVHMLSFLASTIILSAVWGLEQREIAVFVGTTLTVLGIAFFAQWSLLSNFTSSILLFVTHPMKIGDTIRILDKDCPFEGEVYDLTYFFVHLKTANGESITVPNSLFLQKPISLVEKTSASSPVS